MKIGNGSSLRNGYSEERWCMVKFLFRRRNYKPNLIEVVLSLNLKVSFLKHQKFVLWIGTASFIFHDFAYIYFCKHQSGAAVFEKSVCYKYLNEKWGKLVSTSEYVQLCCRYIAVIIEQGRLFLWNKDPTWVMPWQIWQESENIRFWRKSISAMYVFGMKIECSHALSPACKM